MPFDNLPERPEITVLRCVRNLIRRPQQWSKGRWQDGDGNSNCLVSAIGVAGSGYTLKHRGMMPVEKQVVRMLVEQLPKPRGVARFQTARGRLIAFNDHPVTSHAMVLYLIDRAIERELAFEKVV